MARIKHGTLVANTVSSFTLTGRGTWVEVVAHGADEVYGTISTALVDTPADPTVRGDDTFVVGSGGFKRVRCSADTDDEIIVKLISATAQDVSLELVSGAGE